MNTRLKASLLVMVLSILLSCSGNQEEFYIAETVDGFTNIHNIKPQWGNEQKIQLEFVQKIGDLDTADDNYALFHPRDIALDNTGTILILDSGNYRIQKFDPSGKYLATFSRQDEGPGEFSFPSTLQIGLENQLYVYDTRRNGVIILNESGNENNTIRSQNRKFSNFTLLKSSNLIANSRGVLEISGNSVIEQEPEP
jgi:hypothetical protein